ncbi:putative UDP-rhamnose:rhamnosyltransferase 1 isoform X2 [Vigna radiata var. radiata]|uniref:UDP-rhamnose:rhamnosyltransferase 1 isoform X1 n=1 Tax=Vigna radiata var. radiata TaxID=3916 RepID=A0A3Q0FIW6_VIGRR|nr:putative UDP-rhamnose:rhamnosyltransferase 1 isoform X1 [Vigna radiata var. radiata]XP_022642183.1 putative UDP-rhamnose:rhamnosyltransferase 1 isoform X2 [Vigna radiata var. radiata]
MAEQREKLHVVVFPWLAFGHIAPFFELAKLIAQKGHKISFISTPRNIHRLPKVPENLQHLVDLIELPLPRVDKLPENAEATMDIPHHLIPYLKLAFDALQQPFAKFLERCKPDWIIYDFAPYWLPPISSKLGISCISFCTFNASAMNTYLESFVGTTSGSESSWDKDIPEEHNESNESGVSDVFRVLKSLDAAQVMAVRSCMEIEGEALKVSKSMNSKPVIPVGLLAPSLQFSEDRNDENWNTILNWLDKQEEGSVVYVAFGSEVKLSDEEFTEISMGLEMSGFPFFWVLKMQNTSKVELQDLVVNESGKGLVWKTWAPQMRTLAHKSVGGFLSHSGWSSVIESLQVGCPLALLPIQNDQFVSARHMEEKRVGVKVERSEHDGKFTRESLANALRSVMLEKTYRSEAQEMSKIFGDKELQQKYIDEFVEYMQIHRPAMND